VYPRKKKVSNKGGKEEKSNTKKKHMKNNPESISVRSLIYNWMVSSSGKVYFVSG